MRSDALASQAGGDAFGLLSLERLGDLDALRREWRLLWQRCPTATPFQSPDWLIPWWRRYGDGRLRYTDPEGRVVEMPLDQWVLEKRLTPGRPSAA